MHPGRGLAGIDRVVLRSEKGEGDGIHHGRKAGCLDEGGAKSLYKLFALPATQTPYIIAVSIQPWGNTMLAPRAFLLDAAGAVKRKTRHSDFAFRLEGLTALLRSHPDESYLMIASDPEFAGQSLSRIVTAVHQTTAAAGPVIFTMYTGSDEASSLQLLSTGSATVTLRSVPDSK